MPDISLFWFPCNLSMNWLTKILFTLAYHLPYRNASIYMYYTKVQAPSHLLYKNKVPIFAQQSPSTRHYMDNSFGVLETAGPRAMAHTTRFILCLRWYTKMLKYTRWGHTRSNNVRLTKLQTFSPMSPPSRKRAEPPQLHSSSTSSSTRRCFVYTTHYTLYTPQCVPFTFSAANAAIIAVVVVAVNPRWCASTPIYIAFNIFAQAVECIRENIASLPALSPSPSIPLVHTSLLPTPLNSCVYEYVLTFCSCAVHSDWHKVEWVLTCMNAHTRHTASHQTTPYTHPYYIFHIHIETHSLPGSTSAKIFPIRHVNVVHYTLYCLHRILLPSIHKRMNERMNPISYQKICWAITSQHVSQFPNSPTRRPVRPVRNVHRVSQNTGRSCRRRRMRWGSNVHWVSAIAITDAITKNTILRFSATHFVTHTM